MAIIEQNDELTIEKLSLGPYVTNTYILTCKETKESVVVDAPGGANQVLNALAGTNPKIILITHNHMDHTGALSQLKNDLKVPVAAHVSDADGLPVSPDLLLKNGDVVDFGKIRLDVFQTPGHTPGSLCFYRGAVFNLRRHPVPRRSRENLVAGRLHADYCIIERKDFHTAG